jgi:hypothetical protein
MGCDPDYDWEPALAPSLNRLGRRYWSVSRPLRVRHPIITADGLSQLSKS